MQFIWGWCTWKLSAASRASQVGMTGATGTASWRSCTAIQLHVYVAHLWLHPLVTGTATGMFTVVGFEGPFYLPTCVYESESTLGVVIHSVS